MDIQIFDDFLNPQECRILKVLAEREGLMDSVVSGQKEGYQSKGRVSQQCWLSHNICRSICERISDRVGLPLSMAENLQVLRYPSGGRYNQHYDSFALDGSEKSQRLTKAGQRVKTALVYLNAVEAGGQTEFPRLDRIVEPMMGRLVVWSNVYTDTIYRHPDSLHAGLPVLSGEKWVANLWFRQPIPPNSQPPEGG